MLRSTLLALFALPFAGCPSCDGTVAPQYAPKAGRCANAARTPFSLAVLDRRPQKTLVGIKKDGWGRESAKVHFDASAEVGDWLRKAIALELRRAGFQVIAAGRLPGQVELTVEVTQFFAEPRVVFIFSSGLHGQVLLEARVQLPNGSEYLRRFKGSSTGSYTWASDSETEQALLEAAQNALATLASELCHLLSRAKPSS